MTQSLLYNHLNLHVLKQNCERTGYKANSRLNIELVIIVQCQMSYIMARTSYFEWDDNDICFVLDQQAKLDFYRASSPKQKFTGTHYPDSEPNNIGSFSLMLCA